MRVLILSALLACASAAPFQPLPIFAIAPIVPAAIPTLSPGDLQAAAIDAKVQAEDQARALADQARLAADVARDQAAVALEDQKTPPAPPAAAIDAKVKAGDDAMLSADQTQLAADIDAKIKAEDTARLMADQARLAADIAREQAELALENQKAQPAPAAAEIDAKEKADDAARFLADQAQQTTNIDAKVKADDEARLLADQAQLAADIEAKVRAEDAARLLADQAQLAADIAREQAELALENQKEKSEEVNSIAKEKSEDLFWNVEDQKWQAIDAVKTVEAKLDGAVANNANALAKSLTYPIVAPVSLPYANLVYTPGLIPLGGVKDEQLIKTAGPEESKDKLEQAKLEGLALAQAPLSYLGAPWVQAPLTLYQPGVLQPLLTPIIKQW